MPEQQEAAGPACKLCSTSEGVLAADTLLTSGAGLTAHYFCLLFSSGLRQAGGEAEGLRGFLGADVQREVKRGARLKCVYCRKKGATVGCAEPRCKKSYHLSCGHGHKAMLQFFDQFKSYCREHRPVQRAPRRGARAGDQATSCLLCRKAVPRKACLATLVSPCCPTFLHRECVQAAALAAAPGTPGGLRECPGCGDGAAWLAEVRRMGVYVPEQLAVTKVAREEEGCTAKLCFCPMEGGRGHCGEGRWEVVQCGECGGRGIHAACGGLEGGAWQCYSCRRAIRQSGGEVPAGEWEEARRHMFATLAAPAPPQHAPALPQHAPALPTSPVKRGLVLTANTSFTDLLGCMLDGGEASPGDSDYESSSQELPRPPGLLQAPFLALLPQAPLPQAPLPQAHLPQFPLPQALLPQAPLPQALLAQRAA